MATAEADLSVRIGVDLVGVGRIERLVTEHGNAEKELFTPGEMAYCRGKRRRFEHLAARFAAKEAVLKAFGTGISNRMRWTEVEVINERTGRPRIALSGAVARHAERRGLRDIDVSLSHAEGLAIAHAVTVWRTEPA